MTAAPPSSPDESTFLVDSLGDRALVLTLGDRLDPDVNSRVHHLASCIKERGLPGVQDVVPAYASVTVHYDPTAWSGGSMGPHAALRVELLHLWQNLNASTPPTPRLVEIPVCYGGVFGPDLGEVARRCQLTEGEVITRHSAALYRVHLLGFAPGFAYLGGLDPSIAAPRLDTPRLKVPSGSVGIAGMQTGIYPLETPGGWRIIGRTPRHLFRPSLEEPCLLRPGDHLRFVPMDAEAFQAWVGP